MKNSLVFFLLRKCHFVRCTPQNAIWQNFLCVEKRRSWLESMYAIFQVIVLFWPFFGSKTSLLTFQVLRPGPCYDLHASFRLSEPIGLDIFQDQLDPSIVIRAGSRYTSSAAWPQWPRRGHFTAFIKIYFTERSASTERGHHFSCRKLGILNFRAFFSIIRSCHMPERSELCNLSCRIRKFFFWRKMCWKKFCC